MKEQDFLQHFVQNAHHLMWFLGAGTSRSAGLPTANDITWDLKLKFYCAQENQDVKAHDINNKAIKSKIQAFMDGRGFPPLWSSTEYSFYFELLFGKDYATQQRYIADALSPSKVSLTVGHRALAGLLGAGHARIVFTTDFDEVIESAYAVVCGRNLTTFHLEGSYAALEALNAERFPFYAKIHGDFRYQSIKNLSDDLRTNDAEIKTAFVAAAARYGLIVAGYSGRDDNVMDMFNQAISQNNAFPHGLLWTTPRLSTVAPVVHELIAAANSKGIRAHIVETGTFDEMLSKLWRQMPNKPADLDGQVRSAAIRRASIKLPPPGTEFPLLRTNALHITVPPQTCGTVVYGEDLYYRDINDKITSAKPNATIAFTDRLLFWGKNEEIERILDTNKVKSFQSFTLTDPVEAMTRYPFIKPFYEAGLARALCQGKPLQLERQFKTFYAVVKPEAAAADEFQPLREALPAFGKPGTISGIVPGSGTVPWSEAVALRLEERNGQLWLLLRPDIWISPEMPRKEATDFLRGKKLRRWNKQSNELLNVWISLLLGQIGGAPATVTSFPGSDYPCSFGISTRSAYSRGIAHGPS
ncbi:MAG TPA: SIR2 family protein [Terriglobales bacterium]|nr:SIR2 family protein [Terriglobales bacterium]